MQQQDLNQVREAKHSGVIFTLVIAVDVIFAKQNYNQNGYFRSECHKEYIDTFPSINLPSSCPDGGLQPLMIDVFTTKLYYVCF